MAASAHTQALRFIWRYLRGYWPFLVAIVLTTTATTVAALAQPFFYKAAIDAVAKATPGDGAVVQFAVIQILLGVLVGALTIFFEQGSGMMVGWIEAQIMRKIHLDVFAHVQRLSADFHVDAFAGATARKITRGVESFEGVMDRLILNFFPTAMIMVGFTIVLTSFAPPVAIVVLVGMALYIALSFILNIYLSRAYAWVDQQDTHVTGNLVDAITANAVVKSFAAEEREDVRQAGLMSEWRRRQWRVWAFGTVVRIAQYLFLMLLEMAILLIALKLWNDGAFTAGGFVVIVLYIGQIWAKLWDIGRNMHDYMKGIAHTQEMVEIAQRKLQVSDASGAAVLRVPKGAVRFEKVGFRYDPKSRWIFRDFSVAVAPGQTVALVGHSGGGKSTFVKLLLRLYDVQEGRITIDDQGIACVTQESLRSAIGLVPQEPILFHRSIRENIAYGRPGATDAQIEEAARKAHAHEFITQLPHGYETLVGERGVKLSGGERQRVAIARAMLADKPILILDEATSSLDSVSERYIQEALETLMRGRTSVVIAHRLSTIKRADRILVVDRGQIIEDGTHAELLEKKDGLYKHLFELQAGGFIGE